MYTSNPLPIGARRALREYRNAEAQHSFAQIQNKTRAVAIKLLAGRKVVGEQARALRLYVGVDDGKWRTYSEIAAQMKVSKEWVRKLLLPSKITLASMVEGKLPWPAYERKTGYRVGNEKPLSRESRSSCKHEKVKACPDQSIGYQEGGGLLNVLLLGLTTLRCQN